MRKNSESVSLEVMLQKFTFPVSVWFLRSCVTLVRSLPLSESQFSYLKLSSCHIKDPMIL
jgi:hypothetical protein